MTIFKIPKSTLRVLYQCHQVYSNIIYSVRLPVEFKSQLWGNSSKRAWYLCDDNLHQFIESVPTDVWEQAIFVNSLPIIYCVEGLTLKVTMKVKLTPE